MAPLSVLLVFAGAIQAADEITVCAATRLRRQGVEVEIRGVGWSGPDGLTMGDLSCPVRSRGRDELPTMLIVGPPRFADAKEEALFQQNGIEEAAKRHPKRWYQVLVKGTLTCQERFRVEYNESGKAMFANGFGQNGLASCVLVSAVVLTLRPLD